jgi:hypothetical protein
MLVGRAEGDVGSVGHLEGAGGGQRASQRSQAVCSRPLDLPIATFDLLGDFTTLKLPRCIPSP